jgi:chemotaxis protein MotB
MLLLACVSQSSYDAAQAQNQQLQSQNQQLQTQLTAMQRQATFVEAGDLLFASGSYQLSTAGKADLATTVIPKLAALQNAKVVVYGYTDDTPIGPQLKQMGVADNMALSSRRAGAVVAFLVSQGVNPNVISAKGFGDTHPVAPNNTPANRAQNRRIVITMQGPGAAGA